GAARQGHLHRAQPRPSRRSRECHRTGAPRRQGVGRRDLGCRPHMEPAQALRGLDALTASTTTRPRNVAATRVVKQRRPASRLSTPRKPGRPSRRLACVLVAMALAFCAVLVRVGTLQTVDAERYTALGESQRVRAVVLPAERGTIFDRNGAELALTVPKKTV